MLPTEYAFPLRVNAALLVNLPGKASACKSQTLPALFPAPIPNFLKMRLGATEFDQIERWGCPNKLHFQAGWWVFKNSYLPVPNETENI
jgi:hypothetical protein